jgi:outer membrane protein assembly factor BamB
VTTSGAAHIDLGVVGSEPDNPGHERRGRAWGRRRHSLRARLAVAAAMTVLVSGVVTGAAPPTAAVGPVHVATVPAGDTALLDGDTLYVHHHLGDAAITAYRLRDGAMMWQTESRPGAGPSPAVWTQDGVPLAAFLDHEPDVWPPVERITAFDPETGAQRWTQVGHASASGDGVIVLMRPPPGEDRVEFGSVILPVAVDLVTGEELWTGRSATLWAAHEYGHRLVTVGDGGVMTSYELATGARVTAAVPDLADPREVILSVAGELVLAHHVPAEVLHAYDVATLTHRWTSQPPPGRWFVSPCGPVVCLYSPTGVHALEPADGEVRWSAVIESMTPPNGFWHSHASSGWPGHLLLDGWLVDAETGARVLSLPGWEPLPDGLLRNIGTEPILRRLDWGDADTAPGTWFARLDSDTPGVEVLGQVPGRLDTCAATTSYLVCRDGDDLRIWRLP